MRGAAVCVVLYLGISITFFTRLCLCSQRERIFSHIITTIICDWGVGFYCYCYMEEIAGRDNTFGRSNLPNMVIKYAHFLTGKCNNQLHLLEVAKFIAFLIRDFFQEKDVRRGRRQNFPNLFILGLTLPSVHKVEDVKAQKHTETWKTLSRNDDSI